MQEILIKNLKDIERYVLTHRYGIGTTPKTYKELSVELNKSPSALMSIVKRAKRKLRDNSTREEFERSMETFLDDDLGYAMFDYSSITNASRECILCGLPIPEEEVVVGRRRHKECSFKRFAEEMAIHKKRKPRSLEYLKVWKDYHGDIPKGMHIHHIDGDHTNNDIDNLMLVTPRQHYEIHYKQGDYLAAELIKRKFL